MKLFGKSGDRSIQDTQIAALTAEIERLAPEPMHVGHAIGYDTPAHEARYFEWYLFGDEEPADVVTLSRTFTSELVDPDGEDPTTIESWGVQLSPRRGELIGEFVISQSTSINMKVRNLSRAHHEREKNLRRGKKTMKRRGIDVRSTEFELAVAQDPNMQWFYKPGTVQVTSNTEMVVYDRDGKFAPDPLIQQWLKAMDAENEGDPSAFALLYDAVTAHTEAIDLKSLSVVTPKRKLAAEVLQLLQTLDPADRLPRTPFV